MVGAQYNKSSRIHMPFYFLPSPFSSLCDDVRHHDKSSMPDPPHQRHSARRCCWNHTGRQNQSRWRKRPCNENKQVFFLTDGETSLMVDSCNVIYIYMLIHAHTSLIELIWSAHMSSYQFLFHCWPLVLMAPLAPCDFEHWVSRCIEFQGAFCDRNPIETLCPTHSYLPNPVGSGMSR